MCVQVQCCNLSVCVVVFHMYAYLSVFYGCLRLHSACGCAIMRPSSRSVRVSLYYLCLWHSIIRSCV